MMRTPLLATIVLLLGATPAPGEIYGWVDENGVTSFSSQPRERAGSAAEKPAPVSDLIPSMPRSTTSVTTNMSTGWISPPCATPTSTGLAKYPMERREWLLSLWTTF